VHFGILCAHLPALRITLILDVVILILLPSCVCWMLCGGQEDFKPVAVAMDGFTWTAERPKGLTFVDQKWGYRGLSMGAGADRPLLLMLRPLSCAATCMLTGVVQANAWWSGCCCRVMG
jgi:hypothetical protein